MSVLPIKARSLFSPHWLVIFVAVSLFSAAAWAEEPEGMSEEDYIKAATWVSKRIDIDIDLSVPVPQYQGKLLVELEAESSNALYLVMNSREKSFEMKSLKLNRKDGSPLPAYDVVLERKIPGEGQSTLSEVQFAETLPKGTKVVAEFAYEFVKEQGQVLQNPDLSYASWVTAWYPTAIAPEEGLISQHSVSLPSKLTFTLPKGWSVLSNGELTEDKVKNGKTVQTWVTDTAISRSYVAAKYHVSNVKVDGIDIGIYTLTVDPALAKESSKLYAKIIDIEQERFGPYPYKTFALAEIPDGVTDYFGASSEQGFIVAITMIFNSPGSRELFSHEAGHSWFGNLTGCYGPGEPVCSEAAAQMGPLAVVMELDGQEKLNELLDLSTEGFVAYSSARGYFSAIRSNLDVPIGEMESGHPMLHRLMDSKGMWFWHMLRLEVGDDIFYATLREVTSEGKSMPLKDLTARFSKNAGRDLLTFFDQWLYRTGAPVIDLAWENAMEVKYNEWAEKDMEELLMSLERVHGTTTVTLTQEQPDLYDLNIPVRFNFYEGDSETKVLKLNEKQKSFSFDFDKSIESIDLDPDRTVLLWRPAYGPKPTYDKKAASE